MSALLKPFEKHEKIIQTLKNYYLNDDRIWAVGYSGGKDSTVTLDLVFKALLRVKNPVKKVYVQFSDTLLEMDPVIDGINKSLDNIKAFAKKHQLPVEVIRVKPELKHSFFSLLIGKGYTLPRRDYRWCTDRMKIKPQQKVIDSLLEISNGFVSVTGVRKAEGVDRANRINSNTIDGMLKKHDLPNCNMLTPIEDFSADDVWSYLYTQALDWVDANELGRVYSLAAGDDGECRTLLEGVEGEQAGCSKSARYGCWLCPLFKEDKTLKNLASHYDYMKDMEQFRNWLQGFQINNWEVRDVYNHRDHKKQVYDKKNHRFGMVSPGGYTLDFRKRILKKLIDLDRRVYPQRGTHLISDSELEYIQECWIEEGDFELSVFTIANERKLSLSNKHLAIRDSLLIYKAFYYKEPKKTKGVQRWFPPHWTYKNERYFAQLSKQLHEKNINPVEIAKKTVLRDLSGNEKQLLDTLPANTTQYFPSKEEECYIREEWKKDEIGFMTMLKELENENIKKPESNLFGYDGDYGKHFEQLDELNEVGDITLCKTISLADKMAFFN